MFQIKSNKLLTSTTLTLIILGSALVAASGAINQTPPYFQLWASLGPDRFWGYYAGYHDIMYRIQAEWAKLGIDLQLVIQGDMYDNWYLIWESPLGGQPPGKPPGHWDLTPFEWWIHPHGFLWMDGIILSEMITPAGYNAEPYLSKENDELYMKMQQSFEADVRQRYCLEWQEYAMHNPSAHNWYYPNIYQMRAKYLNGWYATTWFYDVRNMYINQTLVEELNTKGVLGANYERLARTVGNPNTTIIYGAGEAWWSYLNLYCDSYTEEAYQNLVTSTLYASSLDPWPAEGTVPQAEDFKFVPKLAEFDPYELPSVANATGDNDPYEEPFVVKLREGVKWSDGEDLTAEDVVFSHRYSLDPLMLSTAYGDFAPVVKRVEYCDSNNNTVASPDSPGYDPHRVKYVLYDDNVDLKLYLGNTWGAGIMPEHALGDIDPYMLRNSPVNKQFAKARDRVPSLGPYKFYAESTPAGYADITLERNPLYFGYDLGWGPTGIDYIIMKYSPDAEVRFSELETHAMDLAEYPTAPLEQFEVMPTDEFWLMKGPYMASNLLWFNFNNPQLSNRYLRLATAYATPYDAIFSEILPAWGIVDPIPPKTWVLPWSVYTEPAGYGGETVALYNTEIEPYTYDLDIAQQYMNMWLYSLDAATMPGNDLSANYNKGPVGDANFDGEVGLRDIFLTIAEFGNAPLTRKIDWWNLDWSEGIYPWPVTGDTSTSPIAPGNDVDPDFNNDGTVTIEDFTLCAANWGAEYPFEGAW